MVIFKRCISIWVLTTILIDGLIGNKNRFKIKRLLYPIAILVFLSINIACNKDKDEYPLEGTVLSMNDISGNWEATPLTTATIHFFSM